MSTLSTNLKMKRIGDHKIPMPHHQQSHDAGLDLYCAYEVTIPSGEQMLLRTGWAMEIPQGFVGLIRDRSGMAVNSRLVVNAGVVDAGYRGEICVLLSNESIHEQHIIPEERIAQMVIVPYLKVEGVTVDNLPPSTRGADGFGSSGK